MESTRIPSPEEVLQYWNTFEFFNFYSLNENLRDREYKYIDESSESFPWQSTSENKNSKYIIYFGLTPLKEIKSFLEINLDDKFTIQNYGDKTCVAKIELIDEHGFAKLDNLSISTLHWAISKFARKEIPLHSGFIDYRNDFLTLFNNTMAPFVKRIRTEEINFNILKRILNRFLCSEPSSDGRLDIWCPNYANPSFIVEKRAKSGQSFILNSLKRYKSDVSKDFECLYNITSNFLKVYNDSSNGDDSLEFHLQKFHSLVNDFFKDEISLTDLSRLIDEAFNIKEVGILNSFFLDDIEQCLRLWEKGRLPKTVKAYLDKQDQVLDLFQNENKDKIIDCLAPNLCPRGRWPSNPAYSMTFMQQFAVNKIIQKSETIFSVNGPPGTGKTTLLKDVFADLMVQRASVLAKLPSAGSAFKPKKVVCSVGSIFTYPLIDELTGFEILIASGNNGAVENISKELPLRDEIFEDYKDSISFLRPIAQLWELNEGKKKKPRELSQYWGTFSAALGRNSNRKRFTEKFDYAQDLKPEYKGQLNRSGIFSLSDWLKRPEMKLSFEEAQSEFLTQFQIVEELIEEAQIDFEFCLTRIKDEKRMLELDREKTLLEHSIQATKSRLVDTNERLNDVIIFLKHRSEPSVFAYLFNRKAAIKQRDYYNELHDRLQSLEYEVQLEKANLARLECRLELVKTDQLDIQSKEPLSRELKDQLEFLKKNIDDPDLQTQIPFHCPKLNDEKSKLFISALTLHESWLETVKGSRLRTLVYQLNRVLHDSSFRAEPMGKALFQQLFMIVPVISSTFASIQSFLKSIDEGEIGWLCIDEAGQAPPQAALGAIFRSKQIVVVGDPLQLEPVITMPKAISDSLTKHFELHHGSFQDYDASTQSVQTLADRSHSWGGWFDDVRVGCPLRVHRRCSEPMFSLANRIAYNDKMILGKSISEKQHYPASAWFDSTGQATGRRGHWVNEQGEDIMRLLETLELESLEHLDFTSIFVISPFKEVVEEARRYLADNLSQPLKKKCNSSWRKSNIGTIHTFQGKEANIVILLLGLDNETNSSAHTIVGYKPNLLNVAATRAKESIYIIGNVKVWRDVFSFDEAYKRLRVLPRANPVVNSYSQEPLSETRVF